MKKVLVANIFGIGDVIFTSPLISNLKREFPGISMGYLCNARTADMVRLIPGVEEVFVYEKDRYIEEWKISRLSCLRNLYGFFRSVRDKGYDTVFDLTNSREFGAFFALSGIRKRVGLNYRGRGTFLTHKVPLSGFSGRHVVEYYLDLLDPVGVSPRDRELKIVPDSPIRDRASEYISRKGLADKGFVSVVPGGGASWGLNASRKRWHAEGFAAAAEALEKNGIPIVILGDRSERKLCEFVSSEMGSPARVVENDLSLAEYIGLMDRAKVVLCNDGGPLHIAVALGVRTVSIFGPVDEKVYGPYPLTERHMVMKSEGLGCRPCYDRFKLPDCEYDSRCLSDISPQTVAEACGSLFKDGKK